METVYLTDITGTIGEWLDVWFDDEVPNEVIKLLREAYRLATKELETPAVKHIRTKMEEKFNIAIWKHEYGNDVWYTIHQEDVCNSLEEICYAYHGGNEVELVAEVIKRGNTVDFTDNATYEEYLAQFENYGQTESIYPHCCFETYEKAKEIFDLLDV